MSQRSFGWEHEEETRRHRERLVAEGFKPGSAELHFAVVKAYEDAHANDLTLRQRQQARKSDRIDPRAPEEFPLTEEEIAYLAERLEGVNDPVGSAALAKLNHMLGRSNEQLPTPGF
jgi:hypothetical protein